MKNKLSEFCQKNFIRLEKALKSRKFLSLLIVSSLFILLIISRRPDVVTTPGFWAEDGIFWYSEAYNADKFWDPFLIPKQGYFQTISRIGAGLSQFFDIGYAPLIFNLVAILIQVLPALFFLSKRFEKIVPSLLGRVLIGFIYIGLLGTSETHTNLTNAQWRLSILMFLIIIAGYTKNIFWNLFDFIFLLIAGLSGPFIFVAFPVALLYGYFKDFKKIIIRLCVLIVAFLIQLYSFIFIVNDATRSEKELGADIIIFFKILARNIFIKPVLGPDHARDIAHLGFWERGYIPIFIGIFGILALLYVFLKSNLELKFLIIFSFGIFMGGLITPQVSLVKDQWVVMAGGSGGRYYLLPGLAWMISLFFIAFYKKQNIFLKYSAIFVILLYLIIGLPEDWKLKKYKDYNFRQQAEEFNSLNSGEIYTFKINPNSGWKMNLVKK